MSKIIVCINGIKLLFNYNKCQITSNDISINSGIFQGDSLSPILFCLSLIPLSKMLNDCHYGYNIFNESVNHLF